MNLNEWLGESQDPNHQEPQTSKPNHSLRFHPTSAMVDGVTNLRPKFHRTLHFPLPTACNLTKYLHSCHFLSSTSDQSEKKNNTAEEEQKYWTSHSKLDDSLYHVDFPFVYVRNNQNKHLQKSHMAMLLTTKTHWRKTNPRHPKFSKYLVSRCLEPLN